MLKKAVNGELHCRRPADDGEPILTSRACRSKAAAEKDVDPVTTNALLDASRRGGPAAGKFYTKKLNIHCIYFLKLFCTDHWRASRGQAQASASQAGSNASACQSRVTCGLLSRSNNGTPCSAA